MIMYKLNVCFHSNLVFRYSHKNTVKIFKRQGFNRELQRSACWWEAGQWSWYTY